MRDILSLTNSSALIADSFFVHKKSYREVMIIVAFT
jgi:hypothetical protein